MQGRKGRSGMVLWTVIYGNYLWVIRFCDFHSICQNAPQCGQIPALSDIMSRLGMNSALCIPANISERPQITCSTITDWGTIPIDDSARPDPIAVIPWTYTILF